MAAQDPAAMFGFDASAMAMPPSLVGASTTTGASADNSAAPVPPPGSTAPSYFPQSNWPFNDTDTPPYEAFESSAAADAPGLFQTADWELPHQPARDAAADSVSPTSLYAQSISSNSAAASATHPAQSRGALSAAQQEKLRSIAMPAHQPYHSPKSEPSPVSSSSEAKGAVQSSPEPLEGSSKTGNRKRKSSADVDDDDDDDDDGQQPVKKTAHNMIEKRYRTNLNDKIAALRDSVPSLRIMTKSARGEDTTEDREELHGLTPAHKLNKATVLSKATEYIRHLEKRNNRLQEENKKFKARIEAFEKLVVTGSLNSTISPIHPSPGTPMQYSQDGQPFINPPLATPGGAERGVASTGMMPVSDEMKRILSAQMAASQVYPVPQQGYPPNPALVRQQQIQAQQIQQQQNRWRNAGPYLNKLIVGSVAGMMIIEAVRESEMSNETPEGRGLFALPVHLVAMVTSNLHIHWMGNYVSSAQVTATLRLLALIGSLLWLFVPSLFAAGNERPPQKTQNARASLQAVPSLASPIHVRRQAWLTAIQTVWVPRHNFLLEAAALVLKTMKLSLRNTIGTHGYQMLTGLTEEQEAARVKAWTIALDAQLAGGDVEINKSRLTLTLLASGTLPDTPLRLMLKALHIRVLLWDLGKNGLQLGLLDLVAAKLAKAKWNEARQLLRMMNQLRQAGKPPPNDDELPNHLAALLDEDCDDVLNDNIIQRAHNLAWNMPTTHNISEQTDGMNAVVDDLAVRSPMDAVAAWWSSQTLQKTLAASLAVDRGDAELRQDLAVNASLAIRTAPIGSDAQARALVATAVLVDEKRGTNIANALQAIGPLNTGKLLERTTSAIIESPPPASPDEHMALRCAMAMAHLQRTKTVAPPHDGMRLIDTIVVPRSTASMSLLACTAAFRLMEELHAHRAAAETFSAALERLSGSLRIWVGSEAGDRCGLGQAVRHQMVDRCLAITKSVVGMENDTGYGSMSECEDEDGC